MDRGAGEDRSEKHTPPGTELKVMLVHFAPARRHVQQVVPIENFKDAQAVRFQPLNCHNSPESAAPVRMNESWTGHTEMYS